MTLTTFRLVPMPLLMPFLLACPSPTPVTPPVTDTSDTEQPQGAVVINGAADAGFGSALALAADGTVWVGAPHGSPPSVHAHHPDGTPHVTLTGEGRFGAALSVDNTGALIVGAPLADQFAGEVFDGSGNRLSTGGQSLGLAVGWTDTWIAANATGWQSATASVITAGRPTALATWQDGQTWMVGVGMAHHSDMLTVNGQTLRAPHDQAEAGFAVAVGDVDGDGQAEWVVGAPGRNEVYVVDLAATTIEATLTGEGRFGAALAVADIDDDGVDDLLVGAPMAANAAGAVHLYTQGRLHLAQQTWTGSQEGAMQGFAVAMTGGHLAFGAPGAPGDSGRVTLIAL